MNNFIYIPLKDLENLEESVNNRYYNSLIFNKNFELISEIIKEFVDIEIDYNIENSVFDFTNNIIKLKFTDTKHLLHEFMHYLQYQLEFAPFSNDFNSSISEMVAEQIACDITKIKKDLTNDYVYGYRKKILNKGYSANMIDKMYNKRKKAVEKELIRFIPNIFKFFS